MNVVDRLMFGSHESPRVLTMRSTNRRVFARIPPGHDEVSDEDNRITPFPAGNGELYVRSELLG